MSVSSIGVEVETGRPSGDSSSRPRFGRGATSFGLAEPFHDESAARVDTEREYVALVQRIAEGNETAFHLLYDRTHRLVMSSAYRIVNNRETAEEVKMDVFLQVWSHASRYDAARGSVFGWITSVTRNKAIDRLRFSRRTKRRNCSLEGSYSDIAAPGDAENTVNLGERMRLLELGLRRLSPDERRTIEAAYLLELTHEEVAMKLGMPLGTVKTRIRMGLSKLRLSVGPVQNGRS